MNFLNAYFLTKGKKLKESVLNNTSVKVESDASQDCISNSRENSIVGIPKKNSLSISENVMSIRDDRNSPSCSLLNRGNTKKSFCCEICRKRFELKMDLDQHIEEYHNKVLKVDLSLNLDNVNVNNCSIASSTNVEKQVESHDPVKLEYLRYFGLVTNEEKETMMKRQKKVTLQCNRCFVVFNRKELYARHINYCRSRVFEKKNVDRYVCIVCCSHFSKQLLLNNHIRNGCQHWKCWQCKVVFVSSDLWSDHMEFLELNKFCCKVDEDINDNNNNNASNLSSIKIENVGENLETSRINLIKNEESLLQNCTVKGCQQPRKCEECLVVFKTSDSWRAHMDFRLKNNLCLKIDNSDVIDHNKFAINTIVKQEPMNVDDNGFPTSVKLENNAKFTCTFCNLSVSNKHSLALHMAVHEECSRYKYCNVCQKRFKEILLWKNHMKTHKEQLDLLMSQNEPSVSEFNVNSDVLRQFENSITALSSVNENIIIKLEEDQGNDESLNNRVDPVVTTNNCVYGPSTSNLVLDLSHNDFDGHVVETSGRVDKSIDLAIVKPEPPALEKNKCHICDKKYVHNINLTKHLLVHSNDSPHQCQDCLRRFMNRCNLTNHRKGSRCVPIIKQEDLSVVVKTEVASASVSSAGIKKETGLLIQLKQENVDETQSLTFECNVCHRQFTSNRGVECHLKVHYWNRIRRDTKASKNSVKKKSNQREWQFLEKNEMEEHEMAQRPSEYKCADCGKLFPFNMTLAVHIIREHT